MERKLISVIMCVYNTEQEYLDDAVKSILNQTYDNLELIIVDDASSIDLYRSNLYKNKMIRVVRNKENKGPSFSRNVGINLAKGSYIAFMDSDDISTLDRIEKQYLFLENNNEYIACSSWYKEFQNRSREIRVSIDDFEYYRCCLFFKNSPPLNCSALMCRAEVLKTIKLDEKIRFGEDWKLWVQLSECGKIYNLKEVLSFYRIHNNGLTSRHRKGQKINEFNEAISARAYVKNKLGIELTFLEDESLYLTKLCKKINPKIVRSAIDKLLSHNLDSCYYSQKSLEKKCDEVWIDYIKMLWNPFLLISGLKLKNNRILGIKRKQIHAFLCRIFKKNKRNQLKKYLRNHKKLPSYNNVSLYYWSRIDNFGDYLSNIIFEHFTSSIPQNKKNKQALIFGLGSILNLISVDSTVWGSGFRCSENANQSKDRLCGLNLDLRLIRGPLTRDKLLEMGFECPKLYGDPAIIMPIIYEPKVVHNPNGVLIIAHYSDYDDFMKSKYSNMVVNAGTKDYKMIINKIRLSKKVISSSLHGIILAESYGVPAVLVNVNPDLDLFKYQDYYLSTNRKNVPIAHSLEEAINMEPPKLPDNLKELQQNILNSFPYDLFGRH